MKIPLIMISLFLTILPTVHVYGQEKAGLLDVPREVLLTHIVPYLSCNDRAAMRLACKEFASVLFKPIKKIEHDKISGERDALAINDKLKRYAGSPYIEEIRINENFPFDQDRLPHIIGIAKKINWDTVVTFQNLKVLSACGVFLKAVPFSWENFRCLRDLDLSQNFIEDIKPLYALPDTLKKLNLSFNNITKIPHGISEQPCFKNLEELNLHFQNTFECNIQNDKRSNMSELAKLPALRKLRISGLSGETKKEPYPAVLHSTLIDDE